MEDELETYGACVVLVPAPNDLPDTVKGGQHVTLAYFGNERLPQPEFEELLDTVASYAQLYSGNGILDVKGLGTLGEDGDAAVLLLDDSPESEAVHIRQELLSSLSEDLYSIFAEKEKYPTYRPHMTLGYYSDGYQDLAIDIPEQLVFDTIAVWNGEDRISFKVKSDEEVDLAHIGIIRKSGRYPWGSGANPYQRSRDFLGMVDDLKKQGLTEKEIAEGLGINTRELRANKSIAKTKVRQANEAMAIQLKDRGFSNTAIGEKMGINESSVRNLLNPVMKERRSQLDSTADRLKEAIDKGQFLDVSEGSELYLGVSRNTLKTAVTMLEDEGYKVQYLKIRQQNTGNETTTLVLTPGDLEYKDFLAQTDKISVPGFHSDDGGKTWTDPKPPVSVDSKRLTVRYGSEGGADMDGVIELRPGVSDLSLGNSRYAQVRIAVDGSHYLKGMAIYSNDLPPGTDIRFNTNKEKSASKLDALKAMSDDPLNPWGAVIKAGGQKGALNIVNEEGDWIKWSKNLSSQMLSKQQPELAKKQLDLTFDIKRAEFDEINSLTNPVVKRHLLEKFADGADSSAVYLKAKGLPGTQNHVILPITNMKPTEVYAPQYKNGERVVLIRHPHGGIFEIPELTVNNKHPAAKSIIGQAIDAIGINPKVAEQLSGADFDGDTVLVIPNRRDKGTPIQTSPSLKQLKNFDPKTQYGHDRKIETKTASGKKSVRYFRNGVEFKGMTNTQTEMGMISNLITDMTIQGAVQSEIARAVKHSMVVIDAEKHGLNYKQSYLDNGIKELKAKYQGGANGGASTLISRAKGDARLPERELRKAGQGGPIDPATGKKVYVNTGNSYTDANGKVVNKITKTTKMDATDDAFTLVSKGGTPIEKVYATHANKLKALANQARKAMIETKPQPYDSVAFKAHAPAIKTLNAKLNVALKNAPLERKANLLAEAVVKQKRQANPHMSKDDVKKARQQALAQARVRTGAGKQRIDITPAEWAAIQSGGVSTNKLTAILRNADLDVVKGLATPRANTVMSTAKMARAKAMLGAGYTQAEIAAALGVPKGTVNSALSQ